MLLDWRNTLKTLLPQFEARAANSSGVYHMMVEVANEERNKMLGPSWFKPFTDRPHVVDGKIKYQKWDCSRSTGLLNLPPGFREPIPGEMFDETNSVIRDKKGIVRAVPVPMKLQRSYFCGQLPEEVNKFESLANMAALALLDATDLSEHFLASELCDLFRKPHGGIRYVFGEIPEAPHQFIAQGWNCGILQYDHGVLIDVPISETTPDSKHWTLLLHRLGWRKPEGSPLTAYRASWKDNSEVAYDMLDARYPDQLKKQFEKFSKTSFYSVLGSKEAPVDINLASIFAIQLLTANMTSNQPAPSTETPHIDYSNERWNQLKCPSVISVSKQDLRKGQLPKIGIIVATEIERQSVLNRLKPPQGRRSILQIYEGNNTYFIGRLGITNIVLVMCAMGSTGRDASSIVTSELIDSWHLNAVVMVGIAFGKDAKKQMIGGVLVSERIISYEPQRLGTKENQNRGEEHQSSPVLLNRFRNVLGWNFKNPSGLLCNHQIGAVLSGEKLIDNAEKKSELFTRYPAAIGGEMEGAGFAAAAKRKRCEWILLKAICDWGDGTKQKHHQGFAAAASVDLLSHVLNQPGVLDAINS